MTRFSHALETKAVKSTALVAVPALALILIAWLFIAGLVRYEFADTIREAYRENENLALALEAHTARTFGSVEQMLQFVAHEYAERGDLERVDEALAVNQGYVQSIIVVDRDGNVRSGNRGAAEASLADRDFFRYHRDHAGHSLLVGQPLRGRLSGKTIIPVSRRLEAPGGGFGGILSAAVDPGYFDKFYQQVAIGRQGMVLLVGLDGIARARHAGDLQSSGQDMRGSTLLREQARHPSGSFLSAGRVEGVARYTSYRTVPEYGLVVAVGTAQDEVLAPYYERRNVYLWSGGIFSLLVLGSAIVIVVSVLHRQLTAEARQREEARFRATFDQRAIGMAHTSTEGRFLRVNRKLADMLGYSPGELVGRSFAEITHPDDRSLSEAARKSGIVGAAPVFEKRYVRKDGTTLWVALTTSTVEDPSGGADYFVATMQDITERKQAQEQVIHQATHDLLTDLPNRALFQDRLGHALRQAERRGWTMGVMFLDLDRFKAANDAFGHAAGDALLREVARRLSRCVRASDTAARIGGDEFAVVLAELAQPEDATVVAKKILEAMAAPAALDGREYRISVSVGITLFPGDGRDAESLLRNADAAMFRAKQAGGSAYRFFARETGVPEAEPTPA